jgi:hypothetical protein
MSGEEVLDVDSEVFMYQLWSSTVTGCPDEITY